MSTPSLSSDHDLKKRIMDQLNSLNEVKTEPKVSIKPTSTTAKPKPPLLDITVDVEGKLEYTEIIGHPTSDGLKHYFKLEKRTPDSWHELVRDAIPEELEGYVFPDNPTIATLRMLETGKNLTLKGDTGTGKDTLQIAVAAKLGWPVFRVDGVDGLEAPDLVSYDVPDGNGGFTTVETPLSLCAQYGGLFILSEPNVLPPNTRYSLQSPLEDPPILRRVGAMDATKAIIKCHPDFRIAMTTNTWGVGDDIDKFAGASELQDQSSLNRVGIFETCEYLSTEQEVKAVINYKPELPRKFVKKMVQIGNLIRNSREQGGADALTLAWSMRQLKSWADSIIMDGEPVRGFKHAYYNSLTDTQKQVVKLFWRDVDFEMYEL